MLFLDCYYEMHTSDLNEILALNHFLRSIQKDEAQTQHSLTFQLLWSLSLMRCAVSAEWISLIRAGECLICADQ